MSKWSSKFELKNGTWVYVPSECSIQYGNDLTALLQTKWFPPDYFYHLQRGGHVSAAKAHLNHKFFIHVDIDNFYGRVSKNRIIRELKGFLPYTRAKDVAEESTVKEIRAGKAEFHLPYGFVQSPLLASICLHKSGLGTLLGKLNRHSDLTLSLYMDDIIVSSNSKALLEATLSDLEVASAKSKFPLNSSKTQRPSESVIAFNMHISQRNISLTAKRLGEFRSQLLTPKNPHVRDGILGYVNSVNPTQAEKLALLP